MRHALAAIKNKKAVLCEKPLAINQKSSLGNDTMCSKSTRSFLMEGLWTRFNPDF